MCGAWPLATIRPVAASTTSAFVDWVDVSTPTTSGPSAADIGLSLFRGSAASALCDEDIWWAKDMLSLPSGVCAY
ncbi:hypothetical protein Srubr_06920 [Streptomyces rubradiris]|uniref:Secreted protein n=1 Tax=Streptomyces rubradiris TaxID=285531 RepID=A0ABQ3R4Q7_STRRR|nr:hypothetical protein GCM10018792_25980 [Streptomyces rubradiris]GHI50846.1 hypothetical protein Srubr_06920 [Streptomyces rubradiris]